MPAWAWAGLVYVVLAGFWTWGLCKAAARGNEAEERGRS